MRTAGADRNEILMPNIALIGFKIDPIQQLIRQRQIDTTPPITSRTRVENAAGPGSTRGPGGSYVAARSAGVADSRSESASSYFSSSGTFTICR